jgi:ribonucleoside-diphosphate reductase alpha chain
MPFKTSLGETIFKQKYASNPYETWEDRAHIVVNWVCGDMNGDKNNLMAKSDRDELTQQISEFKFMPGGRYLWYSGRDARFFNNCYLLRLEDDSREEWAGVTQRAMSCLMTGGGVGVDVSSCRPSGRQLRRTGGVASGPIPLLYTLNEVGRNVMQGGSRRSALYGSMNWQHEDAKTLLHAKNWHDMFLGNQQEYTVADMKKLDFNYAAPLDMMNISLNYDDAWLHGDGNDDIFIQNIRQAMMTGEPGFSFNFGEKQNETLRNACTEITSEDDSDVCNLGSVNLANIDSVEELKDVVNLASKFLVCGLIRAHLPYDKVGKVRQKNSRIGLGLMGVHEWLLKRGYKYGMNDELKQWMKVYDSETTRSANEHCDRMFLNKPKGYRAIAPTGTISILAGTTGGIEPIYAVAYRRRYLTDGTRWKHQYVVDATAQALIDLGINPDDIESAVDLAADPEIRIKFQFEMQKFVRDHAISSTINLPTWGTDLNNEDKVKDNANLVKKYARPDSKGNYIRGLTWYPDGSRGGQPISTVPYEEAHSKRGVIFEDNSEEQCLSGVCNI